MQQELKAGALRVNTYIKCPFYRDQSTGNKGKDISITCEGLIDDSASLKNIFQTKNAKQNHINNFCKSDCWQGCLIAVNILRKYEQGGT